MLGIPRNLVRLVLPVIAAGAAVLVAVTANAPDRLDLGPIFFWVVITLVAAALRVSLPGGVSATITTAPLLASVFDPTLSNPFAACWIAFLGTFELRDFRRVNEERKGSAAASSWEVPWYGVLYNRANWVLSVFAGWLLLWVTQSAIRPGDPLGVVAQIVLVGGAFTLANTLLAVLAASARTHSPFARTWAMSVRNIAIGLVSQVPLGWLMAQMASEVGQWAVLLFMVPLLLARYSFSKYTETRDMFFGSVSALSQAIDAKDGFTRGHADRVSRIAGAVAREMGLAEKIIEQIELAGLLHDIGKIGVEDRILMKPGRLDADETELMRRHPIYGASILEPSAALRPLVPLVLHHHENFDGSGYPEKLKGDEIPLGSRIIIVADAYEAMTSDRIYRKAVGHDRAIEQLNHFKGVQFDPTVVRALESTISKHGPEAFEVSDLPPINYETLAELRKRLARPPIPRDSHVG